MCECTFARNGQWETMTPLKLHDQRDFLLAHRIQYSNISTKLPMSTHSLAWLNTFSRRSLDRIFIKDRYKAAQLKSRCKLVIVCNYRFEWKVERTQSKKKNANESFGAGKRVTV